jgi:hypothetical protein
LLDLNEKVDLMNSLLSKALVIKVLVKGFLLSSGFCILSDYFNEIDNNLYQILAMVSFMVCSVMDILVTCRSSQDIINSMESMIKTTKRRISRNSLSSEDYRLAKVILSLRKDIRFRASTLFDLKSVTALMLFSYVTNYAVILIQTSDYNIQTIA